MADSILDRVQTSRDDQEKQSFHAEEVVHALLDALSEKEADVLQRRFGLSETGKETLETIGAEYQVTRERIRQIENQSIQKIKDSANTKELLKPVEHLVISLLTTYGGVLSRTLMYELLLDEHHASPFHQQCVVFILNKLMGERISELPKNKKFHPGWQLVGTDLDFVQATVEAMHDMIEDIGKPLTFEEMYSEFQDHDYHIQNQEKITEDMVFSFLDATTRLAKNPFDEHGLATWGQVNPKRMHDRVFLVLQKEGKPMHFEDIAHRITAVFKKNAYPPTVHNELILNDEYVLVGRGIYALKEWGFKEGVVADILMDILNNERRPMKRSELVAEVLKQRIVKKNTIHLALTDKTLFHKEIDGRYTLNTTEESPEETTEEAVAS